MGSTSPAASQSNSQSSVTSLASYWVSDEVSLIYRPIYVENGPYTSRELSFGGSKYSYSAAMDLVAETLAHLLSPCRVLKDQKPPRYSQLCADRRNLDTRNQDNAMAPPSRHASTTSLAVPKSTSHALVTSLASYFVSDEVLLMFSPRHVKLRPFLFHRFLFCHDASICVAPMYVTAWMLLSYAAALAAWTVWSEDMSSRLSRSALATMPCTRSTGGE